MSSSTDTIYALGSGNLPSGVAVIRVSGPLVRKMLEEISGNIPKPRTAVLRKLRARDGSVLDQGLVLFFPGPASFTGEDIAEFHLHGGKAVVARFLRELSGHIGARQSDPGEFTRRAFLNGRIDLTEAEGLADLVSVETEMQRQLAVRIAEGSARKVYEEWRKRLIGMRAMLESDLDFSDQEDVPGSVADQVWPEAEALVAEMKQHLSGSKPSEIIRDGFRVVLAGVPNAGKSSLLNALAGRDAAIVTEEAGTTRDVIEVALDVRGYRVVICDTAGIREAEGLAEKIGIDRSRKAMSEADLVLLLRPPTGEIPSFPKDFQGRIMEIRSMADLFPDDSGSTGTDLAISAATGQGIDELFDAIHALLLETLHSGQSLVPVLERHRMLVVSAIHSLEEAMAVRGKPEIAAEGLRSASVSIGRITGAVDVEDLLDVIFSQFCIGK